MTFENAYLNCRKAVDTKGDPCSLYFKIVSTGRYATSFKVFDDSEITGQSVTFDGSKSGL